MANVSYCRFALSWVNINLSHVVSFDLLTPRCFCCCCKVTDERSDEEKKAEETELFTKYYTEWKGGGDRDKSYKNIPRFYYRVLQTKPCAITKPPFYQLYSFYQINVNLKKKITFRVTGIRRNKRYSHVEFCPRILKHYYYYYYYSIWHQNKTIHV